MRTPSNPGPPTSRSLSRRRRSRAGCATCWTRSRAVARILVIDDDALLRRAIRVALEPDGLEVIRTVRAEVPDAKIIAMSGGGSLKLDLLAAAEAFGASRTLWKPFVPGVLLSAVRDLLGERGR